jgi:hypothetical protein
MISYTAESNKLSSTGTWHLYLRSLLLIALIFSFCACGVNTKVTSSWRKANYYSNWNPYLSAPRYYDNRKIYYLETHLYDAHAEELIWAAQSETYDPLNINDFLKGYIKSIYKQKVKDGLITPKASRKTFYCIQSVEV